MEKKCLYLILIILLVGCKENVPQENKITENEVYDIEIKVKSPSQNCSYLILIRSDDGNSIFRSSIFDRVNYSLAENRNQFIIDSITDLKKIKHISKTLEFNKPIKGKLRKDGWNYIVTHKEIVKVEVYEYKDSDVLNQLLKLINKYSPDNQIDYNCF